MDKPVFPKIIGIDFDGTVVEDAFPAIGKLRKNAKEVINRLYSEGFYLIIWTCRYGQHKEEALVFLEDNEINFHTCNEHHPGVKAYYENDTRKISADIYIDDRQLGGLPDDWETIYQLIKKHFNYL